MPKKTWVYQPMRVKRTDLPEFVKTEVKSKADQLVESVLKNKYIKPPPEETDLNYLTEIFTKWYRGYFYLCAKYNCPGPYALAPSFNMNFARIEYLDQNSYALAYQMHAGKWFEVARGISIAECLDAIENSGDFIP